MGRLAIKPIEVPKDVTITLNKGVFLVKGPKGELSRNIPPEVRVDISNDERNISVVRTQDTKLGRSLVGTIHMLARNMVLGVTEGFSKILDIEGVGYRATMDGSDLVLSLGFSHPVRVASPDDITITTEKNSIIVTGINKEVVGQVAAIIRGYRPPEPYKGKGVRYRGEYVRRKAGKKTGVG
jgi:large subunit ribosomal protein L6